jgi:hypothetical protein
MSVDDALHEFATLGGCSIAAAQALVADVQAQAGGAWFYVFWVQGGGGEPGSPGRRTRQVIAFATPDAALAFAQRNNLINVAAGPRLRRLSIARLLLAMLREPAITRLVFVHDGATPAAGRLPDGIVVEREAMLQRLRPEPREG